MGQPLKMFSRWPFPIWYDPDFICLHIQYQVGTCTGQTKQMKRSTAAWSTKRLKFYLNLRLVHFVKGRKKGTTTTIKSKASYKVNFQLKEKKKQMICGNGRISASWVNFLKRKAASYSWLSQQSWEWWPRWPPSSWSHSHPLPDCQRSGVKLLTPTSPGMHPNHCGSGTGGGRFGRWGQAFCSLSLGIPYSRNTGKDYQPHGSSC